jgi:hypothetical protein
MPLALPQQDSGLMTLTFSCQSNCAKRALFMRPVSIFADVTEKILQGAFQKLKIKTISRSLNQPANQIIVADAV